MDKQTNEAIWAKLFEPQDDDRNHLIEVHRGALGDLESEPDHSEDDRAAHRKYVEAILSRFEYERYLEPFLRRAHCFNRPVRTKRGHSCMSVSKAVLAVPQRLRRKIAEMTMREARAVDPDAFKKNHYLWNPIALARVLGLEVHEDREYPVARVNETKMWIPPTHDARERRETVLCLVAAAQLRRCGLAYTTGDQDLLAAELAMGRYFRESSAVEYFPQRFVGGWRRHLRNLRVRRHWYTFRDDRPAPAPAPDVDIESDRYWDERRAQLDGKSASETITSDSLEEPEERDLPDSADHPQVAPEPDASQVRATSPQGEEATA